MADYPKDDRLFYQLVEFLEEGLFKKFKKLTEDIPRDRLNKVLAEHDQRSGNEEASKNESEKPAISKYSFRYRPIYRDGLTLLHYAMIFGNAAVVKLLLKLGADPMAKAEGKSQPTNETSRGSYTVVHIPCYVGNLETLKALLSSQESKAKVKELVSVHYQHTFVDGKGSKWKWTPLHYACGANNLKLIELLLEYGAEPMEGKGRSLRYASKVSDYKIVELLVHRHLEQVQCGDADLKKAINEVDHKGMTSLHYACQKKCAKTLKLLLEHGGDAAVGLQQDLEYGADDDKGSEPVSTPLHCAIKEGAEECAITLLETELYSPDYIIGNLLTPELFKELMRQDLTGITIRLLKIGAPAYRNIKLDCFLHKAVLSDAFSSDEFLQIVKGLGKKCIEEKNEDGLTPMMLAASRNMHRKLRMLFKAYIELLEENMFSDKDKEHYHCLYENIVVNTDVQGLSISHLAVQCSGSESDFEETVKALNEIWETMMKLESPREFPDNKKDPFLVKSKCPEDLTWFQEEDVSRKYISALELAFRKCKPERAITIIEVTEARTLKEDKNIIHSALWSNIKKLEFQRLTNLMNKFLAGNDILTEILNYKENNCVPLHLAMKKKLFQHVNILLDINKVELKSDDSEKYLSLYVALENSCTEKIIENILSRFGTIDGQHLLTHLPLQDGMETHAIQMVVKEANSQRGICSLIEKAVEKKQDDIFKMLIMESKSVSLSTLKLVIIKEQNEEFARLIVQYSKDCHLLEKLTAIVGEKSTERTIYFDELIQNMPEVALEALDRSIEVKDNKKISRDYTLLLANGVNIVKSPENAELDSPRNTELDSPQNTELDSLHNAELDSPQNTELDSPQYRELGTELDIPGSSELDSPEKKEIEKLRNIPNDISHPLNLMVDSKEKKLLQHPLVEYYLHQEWRRIGFGLYFLQMALYIAFLVPFSVLVQLVQHPVSDDNSTLIFSTGRKNGVYACSALGIFFMCVEFLYFIGITSAQWKKEYKKSLSFKNIYRYVRKSPECVLQMAVFGLSIAFSIASIVVVASSTHQYSKDMWRTGIFAIIFAWTNLIILGSNFPTLGQYAIIFINIFKTFIKVALFGIVLVMASTIVLRMIFYNPNEVNSPFFTFSGSLVKLITMVTGEIDFQDTFSFSFDPDETSSRNLYDRGMAYFIWILFLVIIPILLSNMLIALAVGDASEIKENAAIKKLELLVYWVTAFQSIKLERITRPLQKLSNLVLEEKERWNILSYGKKREESAEIKNKFSDNFDAETMDTIKEVKEVTMSTQKKLREMEVTHDRALQRLQNGQAHLMKHRPSWPSTS